MERLTELYRRWCGSEPASATLLPLSGSARKYYRITGSGGVVIGCIGTNPKENRAFLAIDASFCSHGLHAPAVYGVSDDGMAYIQEDLGDGQLFELLKPAIASGEYGPQEMKWLKDTIAILPAVQHRVAEGLDWDVCFPDKAFNARMVNFDLNYFKYDFLKFTGLEFDEIRLQDDFDRLREDSLQGIGNTFMYRDFQARNVMIKDGEPCFIDFQGGRRGPVQYDLASFLWNAGTHFSAGMRRELEMTYIDALREFAPVPSVDEFYERYRLITLVRLLQECGAYGFRGIFERKQIFLDCLPPVRQCLRELCSEPFARYPYLTQVLLSVANDWEI
ncbi:MAG: phosphotransferase [Bacteroidales bacterium]|nr:phosphotransferase [Candidatus Cryptobacteroides choladohippi]